MSAEGGGATAPGPRAAEPRPGGGSLVVFFALSYALMWAGFFTIALARIPAHGPLGTALVLLGVFAPSLTAGFLTARAEGGAGLRALLGGVFRWQVPAPFYLFAVSYLAAIKLAAALVLRWTTGAWPRFGNEPWYLMLAAIVFFTPIQAGEEVGWRGYALPRLAARFGLGGASLLLGLLWALWHIPQFFIPEADTYGQSFPVYALQVTALSVAMAWLYARTHGSLLLVMLLHAAVNNTKDIVPSAAPSAASSLTLSASPVGWLTVTGLWIGAVFFLLRMPAWPPRSSAI